MVRKFSPNSDGREPGKAGISRHAIPVRSACVGGERTTAESLYSDPIFRRCQMFVDAHPHKAEWELAKDEDNVLIRNIPPLLDWKKAFVTLSKGAKTPPDARSWSAQRKLLTLTDYDDRLVVLPIHLNLYEWVHMSLRTHYRRLNVMDDLQHDIQLSYERAQGGEGVPILKGSGAHYVCRCILGMSGMGKSTTAKMIFSLFPIVIKHKTWQGKKCPFVQVVWVYVECPYTGSVDLLLRAIIAWYDEVLGTRYGDELPSKAPIYLLLQKVAVIARRHYTGFIVLDEIQNSLINAERHRMLDFVVNWLNSNCCCFLLLGTPDAEPVIKKRLRTGIRLNIDHIYPFEEGRAWDKLFGELLEFDLLRKPPVNIPALRRKTLLLSAGITGLAKRILGYAQYYGIRTGAQALTPSLLERASYLALSGVEGMIEALRSREALKIAAYADMALASGAEIQERLTRACDELRMFGEREERAQHASRDDAIEALLSSRLSFDDAVRLVDHIMADRPGLAVPLIVAEALARQMGAAGTKRSSSAPVTRNTTGRRAQVAAKSARDYEKDGVLHEASKG
ncbi:ATP-binding protein [Paraburkholderia nemoris]|uniref:ATP-binding protein n=1 Tax=Paraburkholderia nemoris TaxID=2793076 RepID=UPI0038B87B7B